jgi:hypothetical protein
MRLSKFRELMADEFGVEYAAVVARDLVLGEFGDRTAEHCIASGEDLREVWLAICKSQSVPIERWHGLNKNTKK